MVKNLMIVESPAKAKTIEKFLGKDFKVKSCYGHIRDLPSKGLSVDVDNDYSPTYEIPKDKKKIVKELKKLAKEAEKIWLATDEDREGEAISWHLCEALDIPIDKAKRIVFHEITKSAIQEAIKNPRKLNFDLVHAQQARRVLDRLVGYELSPILWRKVSARNTLSAGRVQSVAVRLIVDRERAIIKFEPKSSYRVEGYFHLPDKPRNVFKAKLTKRLDNEEVAQEFLEGCKEATYTIKDIKKKPGKKSPVPPFTTSTLQQEASRKLNFTVAKTMRIAQQLYESGKITYMRTDSVNLSKQAIGSAAKEVKQRYGDAYSKPRNFKTKTAGAQEAHEAIRPTYFNNYKAGKNRDQQRLYELIWKRAIASQMSEAKIERTNIKIDISTRPENFSAKAEVITFDGFLKVYQESHDDDRSEKDTATLPPLKKGQTLNLKSIKSIQRFTRPPARYNEARLVRKLEKLGIGRPSTYAPTISTIQKRGYVKKKSTPGKERDYKVLQLKEGEIKTSTQTETTGREKQKLFPTDVGMVVNDFLVEHFGDILDYNFTAEIEEKFDKVAEGQKEWEKMVDSFYQPFHEEVDETKKNAKRATGERKLGKDPETGKPIIARIGKYGPMVQMGSTDAEEKPKFAKLLDHQNIETITLEEALKLFQLPNKLGEYKGKDLAASVGRYGPYIRHGSKFYSLGKDSNVLELTREEAIEIVKERQKQQAKKTIQEFKDENIKVLRGPYGPYVSRGRKNVSVPKDKDPAKLSLEECKELLKNHKSKRRRKRYSKSGKSS